MLLELKPSIKLVDKDNWKGTFQTHQTWTDASLRWIPKNYDDTKKVRLSEFSIWKPEFACQRLKCKNSVYEVDNFGRVSTEDDYEIVASIKTSNIIYPYEVQAVNYAMFLTEPIDVVKISRCSLDSAQTGNN